MTFGEKLQKLRKERGLSQEQLAARISVSRQALSKWEQGTAIPDTENVLQISKLFGVSTDYLLYDDYTSDHDLPAVRAEQEKQEQRFRTMLRVIAGCCTAGIALVGMLILGILSSVYPATYVERPYGVEWIHVYTGLIGFLKNHNLEWLFILCVLALCIGLAAIWYPQVRKVGRKLREKLPKRVKKE